MTAPRAVTVGFGNVRRVTLANDRPFGLIAGPCAMESRAHALEVAHALQAERFVRAENGSARPA